jgi:RHS repeat-associated protein
VAPGDTAVGTRTIAYGYDILNRRTSMNQAGGALVYTYDYDAKDQLTSIADPAGVRTQGYDNAGRLTSVSRAGQTFTYGYDGNGNVRSRTWPDGTTVTSTFTDANQLETLSVAGGQLGSAAQYTFEYDPSGRLSKTTYPTANHLVTDRAYDRAGRLSDLNSHNDAGTVARYQLTRDPVGNPTGITTTRGGAAQHVAYTYDVFDRVTAACVGADCGPTATGKIAYSYDQVGNRLSQTLSGSAGNSQTTHKYDAASQLTGSTVTTPGGTTATTYVYDRLGNLVQAGGDTFTYNLDHTIASAVVGGTATTYAYDGQGIQVSATTAGGAQTRTWQTDVNQALPQLATESVTTGGATTSRGFVSTPDVVPLGLLTGGQTDSYALDTVGGVATVVNPAGSTLAAYDYEPFGGPRSDGTAAGTVNGITNPIQFAGGYQDTTLGARYSTLARVYDPAAGRYHGVDPVAQPFNEPAVSPYVYVADRPTVARDPSGAIPVCSDVNMYSATCEDYRLQRPTQPVIDRPPPNIWAPPKTDPWREVKIWGKRGFGLGLAFSMVMMLGGDSAPDTEAYDVDVDERERRENRCLDEGSPPPPELDFYLPLDTAHNGRAQGAEACLGPWTRKLGYAEQGIQLPPPPGMKPGIPMHAAHLRADRFGGHPIRANLVAAYRYANLSQMKIVENHIARMIGQLTADSSPVRRAHFSAYPVYAKSWHPRYQELGDAPVWVQYHVIMKDAPPYTPSAMNIP